MTAPETEGPPNAVPKPPEGKGKTPVEMPVVKLLAVTLAGAAIAGLAVWSAMYFLRPQSAGGVVFGVLAGLLGTTLGLLVIQPWKARAMVAWPTLLFAAQGVAFFGVILIAVGLYSASRPDPVGLLAGAVASFLFANIAQASVAGARLKAAIAG